MEYKICENCGAKLHVRTLKCPICNVLLTDASKIIKDDINIDSQENIEEKTVTDTDNTQNNTIGENIDIVVPGPIQTTQVTNKKDVKDYVYKAEVRHSLEYTTPLSNTLKVFLTAISMFPMMGQFIGTFIGIFFATYDDNDRSSFGKALILLSVIMFMIYTYSLMITSEILTNSEFTNYLNNLIK